MIRNNLYTKHKAQISLLADKLSDALDKLPYYSENETMEEKMIRESIENVVEKLRDLEHTMEYFSKPTKIGYLRENSTGKFEIDFDNGENSYPLSCGNRLEVYYEDSYCDEGNPKDWYAGRVEYQLRNGQSGYYFYGPGKPFLYNGMKVRVRIND